MNTAHARMHALFPSLLCAAQECAKFPLVVLHKVFVTIAIHNGSSRVVFGQGTAVILAIPVRLIKGAAISGEVRRFMDYSPRCVSRKLEQTLRHGYKAEIGW